MDRCKESVYRGSSWGSKGRCIRNAVIDGYCKQHHPDSVAKRKKKAEEKAAKIAVRALKLNRIQVEK